MTSRINISKKDRIMSRTSKLQSTSIAGLKVSGHLQTWTEISRINYLSNRALEVMKSGKDDLPKIYSFDTTYAPGMRNKTDEDTFAKKFPPHKTSLMNEDQYWGCFYLFPELYDDEYSPVVSIRNIKDVPDLVGGVLTRDLVAACLSYLKRNPILGDYVYIKLDCSAQHLTNIEVLQHYKYLVYLDLSSNMLTDLTVLSHLPYLQYVSASSNRLISVLDYDTPQWFLTEVHYQFNSVKKIRDLSAFWSLTVLDLSHNNIKSISGLDNLIYLRHLDLSFNHIQRLENLNNLRLLWLDLSYNNISSFECGPTTGLWTLSHLEYLNLNENTLVSMKIFLDCSRLRELHVRNNRLSSLLEVAVYMGQMRRLTVLDIRANPICTAPGYKCVVLNSFPLLLTLDAAMVDPVDQCHCKMEMSPDVRMFASRRLLRLLYIEQLSRSHVSPRVPPADTTEIPLVVLVGYEAVGKGTLARRLAAECSSRIALALQHTTAKYHFTDHYITITQNKFDDMLLNGDFLTYSEINGESYGLSRSEASVHSGKVKIVCMDLIGALMLKLRGRRPYLILTSYSDMVSLGLKQYDRKMARHAEIYKRYSIEPKFERSNLQVLLSGRIIINGILNEILMSLNEEKEQSEFQIDSECSLLMDSDARQAAREKESFFRGINLLTMLTSSSSSLDIAGKRMSDKTSQLDVSLYSLYKGSQGTHDEYTSDISGINLVCQEPNTTKRPDSRQDKVSNVSCPKSVVFSKYNSSTWKGATQYDSTKSCKSVTFTSQEKEMMLASVAGTVNEMKKKKIEEEKIRSISTKFRKRRIYQTTGNQEDLDLWLTFVTEIGLLQASNTTQGSVDNYGQRVSKAEDQTHFFKQAQYYQKVLCDASTTDVRDDYETIHRLCPGLFWDTVSMDNPNAAYYKVKRIIKDIANSQKSLMPMFDIDIANITRYSCVEKRLINIRNQIAPRRLFH